MVAVVQARVGSSRFPAKMLAPLGPRTLIEWVLGRVVRATTLDEVVLATSDRPENDPLEEVAKALGILVVRGDEHDVLSRFVNAAELSDAQWIVRVCADNPFIDAGEIDRLVRFAVNNDVDYAFNHLNRLDNHYADGFGAEMMTRTTLLRLARFALDSSDREHVTTGIWNGTVECRVRTFDAPPELAYPHLRFDVDTPEDLRRLERLASLGLSAPAARFVEAAVEQW